MKYIIEQKFVIFMLIVLGLGTISFWGGTEKDEQASGLLRPGNGGVLSPDKNTFSNFFVTDSLVAGSSTASSSTTYIAEFISTATPSLNFTSTGSVGSCLQLTNTVGQNVYARVVGTTLTINTLSCR